MEMGISGLRKRLSDRLARVLLTPSYPYPRRRRENGVLRFEGGSSRAPLHGSVLLENNAEFIISIVPVQQVLAT